MLVITLAVVRQLGLDPGTTCMFKRLTGVPCATCGSTRAAGALVRGDPLAAIALNPLVAFAAMTLPLIVAWLVLTGTRWRIRPGVAAAIVVVLVAANWVYVIWRGN